MPFASRRFDLSTSFTADDGDGSALNHLAALEASRPCACPICAGSAESPAAPEPQYGLNADQRGETGPNGKPSFTVAEAAAQLTRNNVTWNGSGVIGQAATVTYAFRDTAPATMPNGTAGFSAFNAQQIAQAERSLQSWSDVAAITFVRVGSGTTGAGAYSEDARMLFANYSSGASGAAAFAYSPGGGNASVGGDSWYNSSQGSNVNPANLNYGRLTLTHEIGHAIGISHPGDYNAGNGAPTYAKDAIYYEDSRQYSVMSYWSETNTGASFGGYHSAAPLLDDIAAAQRLYGANMSTRTGDTTYGFNSNTGRDFYSASGTAPVIFAAWDAGGYDAFDFSGYGQTQRIDLNAGAFSDVGGLRGNVAVAIGVTIERALGGSGADTMIGNAAANFLGGNAGNDALDGGAGNDRLVGGAGDDRVEGGAGYDATPCSGAFRQSSFVLGADGVTVTGPEGRDLYTGVERFEFVDGVYLLDPNSPGAQVQRMFDTVFGRSADEFGLDYWVDRIEDTGLSLVGVANELAASSEFQQATGGLGNAAFVDYVYNRALGRAPDAAGRAYWVGQLDAGFSRGEMLVSFSESLEHRARTADLTSQGYFQSDDTAQAIALLYDSFTGRLPDAGGLGYWTTQVKSGASTLAQAADLFAASSEFTAATQGKNNAQLVDFMYQNTLDRAPDAGGLTYWTSRLDGGMTRGELLLFFSQSPEHAALMAPHIVGGIDLV